MNHDMRKLNFFLLSVLFFALTFSSCKKRDDDNTDSEKTAIENNLGNSEVTSEKVTVIFNTDGATGAVEPQTVEKGTKITLPLGESMKKDGYKFLGWSLTENGEIITEYTATENEVTLFAVWVKAFTVKFDTDGGSGKFASQTIEKGKTVTKPESKPEKENYVFMGWYDGDTKFDFSTAITTDVDLKAKYAVLLPGVFSVSPTKKVRFSGGNLQYHCKNGTWRFADNQYDCIGIYNDLISASYDGYIDLFGFGAWLEGQDPLQIDYDYRQYDVETDGKNFIGTSAIGEGWETLSIDEWDYLIKRSDKKIGVAKVGVHGGFVILPDEWTLPNDVTFNSGFVEDYRHQSFGDVNDYTIEEWNKMESAGAVLLPAGSWRYVDANGFCMRGNGSGYWSATVYNPERAFRFGFYVERANLIPAPRYHGQSVRLVRVVQD